MIYTFYMASKGKKGNVMKEVGTRLKKLRQEKGLLAKELAEKIGVSESAICCYERNRRIPKDTIKIKLAKFFGMTVEELFFK